MGNWRNRPPRRFPRNRDRARCDPLPETPDDTGYVDDGVPLWEKKFCSIVGVPWQKILGAKKFAYCHPRVLEWDDSAAEEAFQNAKKRFWAKINDLPCDISLLDPHMYVDKINWDVDVDPELIKELDRESCVDYEGKNSGEIQVISQDGCNKNPTGVNNPWETCNNAQSYKAQAHGWNQGGITTNVDKDENPWESSTPLGNKSMQYNAWGCPQGNESWESKQSSNYVNQTNNWNSGMNSRDHSWHWQGENTAKVQGWNNARDSSWGCFQKDSRNLNNGSNPWGCNFNQCVETSNDRAWQGGRCNSWTPADKGLRGREGSSGTQKEKKWRERECDPYWKQQNKHVKKLRDLEITKYGGGLTVTGEDCWKKGGGHRHIAAYKGTRFQRNNY